jgi:hypothetical protein
VSGGQHRVGEVRLAERAGWAARDNDSKNLAPLRRPMGVADMHGKEQQIPVDAADFVRDVRKIAYVIELCFITSSLRPPKSC